MTAPKLYYADEFVQLYHGDFRDVLDLLPRAPDLVLADPPYGETSLEWDRWLQGWPALMPGRSMWCWGSMRVFLDRCDEFGTWRLSQDVVWEKHNGSGFHADRFRRVHEHALHWYRGPWDALYHRVPVTNDATKRTRRSKRRPTHTGHIDQTPYVSKDGGPRLVPSVFYAPSLHGRAVNETEKPSAVQEALIEYACPPDGLVFDPFAGSCSAAVAARALGRRCIAVELREEQCEKAVARRLWQAVLPLGEVPA